MAPSTKGPRPQRHSTQRNNQPRRCNFAFSFLFVLRFDRLCPPLELSTIQVRVREPSEHSSTTTTTFSPLLYSRIGSDVARVDLSIEGTTLCPSCLFTFIRPSWPGWKLEWNFNLNTPRAVNKFAFVEFVVFALYFITFPSSYSTFSSFFSRALSRWTFKLRVTFTLWQFKWFSKLQLFFHQLYQFIPYASSSKSIESLAFTRTKLSTSLKQVLIFSSTFSFLSFASGRKAVQILIWFNQPSNSTVNLICSVNNVHKIQFHQRKYFFIKIKNMETPGVRVERSPNLARAIAEILHSTVPWRWRQSKLNDKLRYDQFRCTHKTFLTFSIHKSSARGSRSNFNNLWSIVFPAKVIVSGEK